MTLFSQNERAGAPLADRMRPRTLDEFIGQEHIVGPGRLLRRAIQADRLTSSIFYGPPGCGKTTLASIIARQTHGAFVKTNAVTSGAADMRVELKKRGTETSYDEVLRQHLMVMDSTATSLSMDNHMPIIVFALRNPENILRVVKGEEIGTIVKEEV